uniref:Serine-threonine/tyrosine-protein kinase catalytic domain-containing protein n=1 Tax=Ananas comosus var. bracteatus TaxID=296719 RepID=A0A6V7QNY8_ANACO|nr:unnamed protein product [Ananas comosus var. bracteatus]
MLRRYLCCGAGSGDCNGRVADEPEPECEKVDGGGDVVRQFSWSEIESVTSGFTSPVIGEGGFSTVYLGHSRAHQLDVLLRLRRHPNVVRLIGFSDDQEEGALVFEYAPNGNLHDKLHGGGGRILGWAERVSIARQVAGRSTTSTSGAATSRWSTATSSPRTSSSARVRRRGSATSVGAAGLRRRGGPAR